MTQRLNLPEGFKKENFKSLLKKRGQQKYGLRLLAMHYLQQGKTLQEVADLMETTIKTVRKWIQRYDLFGIEGLLSIQSGRGRKSMLLLQHKEDLKIAIKELEDKREGGRITGKDVCSMLQKRFNVKCSLSNTYVILKRLNLSWITVRSIHPKADKEAQEAFKKRIS